MQQQVRVERTPFRDRRWVDPLTGIIEVEIEVCSGEKHGVESYLHIGSGDIEISYDRKRIEEEIDKLLSQRREVRRADIERLSELIQIEDQISFQKLSDPRTGSDVLIVPGSSVKGNIRSRIELTLSPRDGKVPSCLPYYSIQQKEPPMGSRGWRHYRIWGYSVGIQRGPRCDATKQRNVCVVCDMFGAPGIASLINVNTFYARAPGNVVELLEYRGERILAAKPGTVFAGNITFRGLTLEELGLLAIGMGQHLEDPKVVLLGKHKYAPFGGKLMGRVVYRVVGVTISEECSGQGEIKPGSRYDGKMVKGFLDACLSAAMEKYRDYIRAVDEHSRALEVNKT